MMKFRFKSFFFIQYFSMGVAGPYFALFLHEKGFSGTQIGLMLGSMPLMVMLCQPLWGYLSDIFNARKALLVVGYLGMGLTILVLSWEMAFPAAFVVVILHAVFRSPIMPISNAVALDYLEENHSVSDYSLFRLWGSISFAISSFLLGGLFLDQILTYFSWLLAGIYILSGLLTLFLPDKEKKFSYSGVRGVKQLLKKPGLVVFLLAIVFIGATMNIVTSYQTLFLDDLQASSWLIGFTVAIQAVIEVPLMAILPWLYTHFSSKTLVLVGAVSLPLRWISYYFIRDPRWVVPTQALHSVAVISFMAVAISLMDRLVGQKWRATGQSLYQTAMSGVGAGMGLYLAGLVFEHFNIRSVWLLNTLLGVLGLGLILVAFTQLDTRDQPEDVPPAP